MNSVPQHVNKRTNEGNTVALIATADSKKSTVKKRCQLITLFIIKGMLKSDVNPDKALIVNSCLQFVHTQRTRRSSPVGSRPSPMLPLGKIHPSIT